MSKFPAYKSARVGDLVPYARNARAHSDAQINKIAASIREFGFLNPVITDGENGIVAGHGRVMAAQKIGMEEVPTVEASHLTETQKRAYVIADNRLAEDASWDDELLRVEFAELANVNFDVELTGFDSQEIDKVFDESKGVHIEEGIEEPEIDSVTVKFDASVRFEVINAVTESIKGISGAEVWIDE